MMGNKLSCAVLFRQAERISSSARATFGSARISMCEPQEGVMLSRVSLAWVGALTLLPHSALAANGADPWSIETAAPDEAVLALADSLPTASIESICRDAQSAALP